MSEPPATPLVTGDVVERTIRAETRLKAVAVVLAVVGFVALAVVVYLSVATDIELARLIQANHNSSDQTLNDIRYAITHLHCTPATGSRALACTVRP